MKCAKTGCEKDGHLMPVVTFASKAAPNVRATFSMPALLLCADHASPDPALYVSDEGWAQIVAAVKKAGRAYPDRSSLEVTFKSLN